MKGVRLRIIHFFKRKREQRKSLDRFFEQLKGIQNRDLVKEYLMRHPEERDPNDPTKIREVIE